MENSLTEVHKKVAPGKIFGAGDNSVNLYFTPTPDIPENHTGVFILEDPDASPETGTTISPGESGLGVIIKDPVLPPDEEKTALLQKNLNCDLQTAQQIYAAHQYAELAQSIAKQFFLSADNVIPKVVFTPKQGDTPSTVQFIMSGKANKHPFWKPSVV